MPGQMDWVGPELGAGGQDNCSAFEGLQQKRFRAGFGKLGRSDAHSEVVAERPESHVEQPVCVFAKRDPVARVVVSAVGETVNVTGVHDAAACDRQEPVPGQSASVIVGWNHSETKSRFPPLLNRCRPLDNCGLAKSLHFGRNRNIQEGTQRHLLFTGEVLADQQPSGVVPEVPVVDTFEERTVQPSESGKFPVRRWFSLLGKGRPEPAGAEVMKRHPNVWSLFAARSNGCPIGAEPKGQFASKGQDFLLEQPLLRQVKDHEEKQRLVGRRIASRPVHFQRGDLLEPIGLYLHSRLQ